MGHHAQGQHDSKVNAALKCLCENQQDWKKTDVENKLQFLIVKLLLGPRDRVKY